MAQALIASLSHHSPSFDSRLVSVKSVVDELSHGQVFLRVFRFFPVSINPPLLHMHFPDNTTLRRKKSGQSLGNCKQSNIISDVEEQWLEKYLILLLFLKV